MDDDAAVLREHYRRLYARQRGTDVQKVLFYNELNRDQREDAALFLSSLAGDASRYAYCIGEDGRVLAVVTRTRADLQRVAEES